MRTPSRSTARARPRDEPARMDDGGVVGDEGAHGARDPDPVPEAGGVHEPVAVAEAEPLVLAERVLERRHALRAARDDDLAALVEPGVDPRLRARPADLVDGVVGRLLHAPRGVLAVEPARRPIEMLRSGAHQAPLRPGRPEAGDLALHDHDPQRRVAAQRGSRRSRGRSGRRRGWRRRRRWSRRGAAAARGRRRRSRARRRRRRDRSRRGSYPRRRVRGRRRCGTRDRHAGADARPDRRDAGPGANAHAPG